MPATNNLLRMKGALDGANLSADFGFFANLFTESIEDYDKDGESDGWCSYDNKESDGNLLDQGKAVC
jgi:hypothetical protein